MPYRLPNQLTQQTMTELQSFIVWREKIVKKLKVKQRPYTGCHCEGFQPENNLLWILRFQNKKRKKDKWSFLIKLVFLLFKLAPREAA